MQDTLIIDTSNAPCGPGFLPGLRLSEGRFAINRRFRLRGWGVAGTRCLRPPKCRPGKRRPGSAHTHPSPLPSLPPPGGRGASRARMCGRGCRWTQVLRADRATRAYPPTGRLELALSGGAVGAHPGLVPGTHIQRASGPRVTPVSEPHQLSLTTTSDQTRQPAEFKHITKRRKRN